MNKQVIVKSRQQAEFDNNLDQNHLIISIREPGDSIPTLYINGHTVAVLYLVFDDVDYEYPPEASYQQISSDQAMEVARFLKAFEEVSSIIIHCHAGISRSSGCGAAILKYYNNDDSQIFNNHRYIPNMLVYRKVLDALNNY